MINTEIWTPHPEKAGVVTFQGYRPFGDVYQEVEKAVNAKFNNDENIGFEYIASDWEFKAKDALWPNGYVAVFVLPGGSEAYRVNVCVMGPAEGYKQMMSAKVWSEDGAFEVCKFVQKLFCYDGILESVA